MSAPARARGRWRSRIRSGRSTRRAPLAPRRALAVAAGLLADRRFGEPRVEPHPVAAFGSMMGTVERLVYADDRRRGLVYAGAGVAVGAGAGRVLGATPAGVAAATYLAAAGNQLRATALEVHGHLAAGDLDAARRTLPALCGRDPARLDESGVAAAVIESVAENTVDAVVAPALWGLAAGAAGALGHRAVNTMDAMVGHRDDRYGWFGWAAARADDIAAWVPARLTALLVATARPHRAPTVARVVRRDAPAHPSPNAGVAEAAFAAALGVELGGPLAYNGRREDRPRLGTGPRPVPADVRRAVTLARNVEDLLVAWLVAAAGIQLARRVRATAASGRSP